MRCVEAQLKLLPLEVEELREAPNRSRILPKVSNFLIDIELHNDSVEPKGELLAHSIEGAASLSSKLNRRLIPEVEGEWSLG